MQLEPDWFFSDGLMNVGLGTKVNPIEMQRLVPGQGQYVRTPKTSPPAGSVLVGADVIQIAAIRADGAVAGDPATLRGVFAKREALRREYAYWLKIFSGAWQPESAIATLRTIAPLLEQRRLDNVGEMLRLKLMESAQTMLHFSEQNLADAPRLLDAFVTSIEQEKDLLDKQACPK